MIAPIENKKLPLGKIVATPGALDALEKSGEPPIKFLIRHRQCDWGIVCAEDWEANDRDLEDGGRILSAYRTSTGIKIYIVTEWDRSATTILLPEEY